MPLQNKSVVFSHSRGYLWGHVWSFSLPWILPDEWLSKHWAAALLIFIIHTSCRLFSELGWKFVTRWKKNEMLFIYINAGATVGDNICAPSTLAVTSDSHYDLLSGAVVTRSVGWWRLLCSSASGRDLMQSSSQRNPRGILPSSLTFTLL